MPTDLNRDTLQRLARLGAMRRIEELRQEEAAIRAAFPELFRPGRRAAASPVAAAPAKRRRRRRKAPQMSAAARKAVSIRMKKYWAERRKAKKG